MEEHKIDYAKLSQERVLSIRELIFECLRKWWIIAICGVMFAVLLGGYKYYRDSKRVQADISSEQKEEIDVEELKKKLTETELQEAENVLQIQENVKMQGDYVKNSLLLQINPYCESLITLQYYVDSDYMLDYTGANPVDYTGDLVMAYESYINNGELGSELQRGYMKDTEARFLTELISCNNAKAKTPISTSSTSNRGYSSGANSLLIEITAPDSETCEILSEGIKSYLQEYGESLKETVGSHTLRLISEGYNEIVDTDLLVYKTDRANSVQNLLERIKSLKENMSDDQLAYVNGVLQIEEDIFEDEIEPAASEVHISKKYVVVGAFGGIVLAVLAVIFIYLLKGTVNSAEDIQFLYNIKILGKLGKKKKFSQMSSDSAEQLQLLLVNMKMTMDIKQSKRVYVCGSCLEQLDSKLVEQLRQEAEKHKLQLEFGGNYLYQSGSLERMLSCDGVILLEKERSSKYADIVNEYRICYEYQKELLGMVMFV